MNDLSEHVNGKVVQYADDTQLLHTRTDDNIHHIKDTETTLKQCKRHFLSNGLLINPSKTQWIFLSSRQLLANIPPPTTIHFDGWKHTSKYPGKELRSVFC